jgi:hypothetical protein
MSVRGGFGGGDLSRNARDLASYPYEITGKIIVLIRIYTFLFIPVMYCERLHVLDQQFSNKSLIE